MFTAGIEEGFTWELTRGAGTDPVSLGISGEQGADLPVGAPCGSGGLCAPVREVWSRGCQADATSTVSSPYGAGRPPPPPTGSRATQEPRDSHKGSPECGASLAAGARLEFTFHSVLHLLQTQARVCMRV